MYTPTPELGNHAQRSTPNPPAGGDTRLLEVPDRDDFVPNRDDFVNGLERTMLTGNGVLTETAPPEGDLRNRFPTQDVRPQPVPDTGAPASLPLAVRPAATTTGGIMLVGSSGGHLAQLLALEPWWALKGRHWVTFRTPDAESLLQEEDVTWAHYPTTRNVPNLFRNAILAARTLRRHRPDAIVSTGAGVALPFFMLGRLLGIPTVYIEVFDRIDSRTLTARLCGPFTSTLLVQWEEQQLLYPHATVVGTLL